MCSCSVYITDDSNIAIFAGESGFFSSLDLAARGHYEVDSAEVQSPDSSVDPLLDPGLCALHFSDPVCGPGPVCQNLFNGEFNKRFAHGNNSII